MHLIDLSRKGRRTARLSAFTLAEVVMSVGIVAVVFGGVLAGYIQSARRAEWSGYALAAQGLAIQQLEQAKSAAWQPSAGKNEITNLNLTAMSFNASSQTWKGYSVGILDLPINGGTNNAIKATNFVTISMLTNVQNTPGVNLQMVQVDTVFVFYAFGGKRLYTNTLVTYLAPDNREASSL